MKIGFIGLGRMGSGLADGCGENLRNDRAIWFGISPGSGSARRAPNFGRGSSSGSKFAQCELTFPDAMHEFNASDGDRRMSKSLEPEHRTQPKFDGSMILFNEIFQVFRRSNSGPRAA